MLKGRRTHKGTSSGPVLCWGASSWSFHRLVCNALYKEGFAGQNVTSGGKILQNQTGPALQITGGPVPALGTPRGMSAADLCDGRLT